MAYRKGYKFHGNHYNTPGVYSYIKSDMRAKKGNGALNIALIGNSKGGIPGKIMFLDDPEIAKEILKGGELLDACLKAYDPVLETKEGVELGGADLIMAIRANSATKGQTSIYQSKEVEATIGKVTASIHANTTGNLTVETTKKYTGTTNKTYKVVVTSEGTKPLAEATYNFMLAAGTEYIEEFDLTMTTAAKVLGDGISIKFDDGNYTKGDTFLIPCTAPVTVTEFVYTIESKDYGEEANMISHKLDDGTDAGTKRLTIYNAKDDRFEILDNVGGTFEIRYLGNETYADVTIVSNGEGDSIKLQTRIGTSDLSAITDLDIDLDPEQFRTIKSLAEHISSFEGYEAIMTKSINPELTVHDFDFVEKANIKVKRQLSAVLRDLKKGAALQSRWIEVNIINREVSNFENYPFTNLSGGTEGRTAQSYVKYFDELAKYDIDYVVPLTDDMSIIAECREHCIAMSERNGKERSLVCGAGTGLSAGFAVQYARRLHHRRVQYFGTGFYDYNGKLYPAYIAAAMHAGRAAFLKVESATADIYNILKPEKTFEGLDRRDMIDNGVLFFDEVVSDVNHKKFYSRLVWDYTTFTEFDDPFEVERSTRAIGDMLSKEIRKRLHKILTGKLTPVGVLESAKNAVLTILKNYIKDGIIIEYRDVTVKKVRDKVNITFEVAPTQVTNFTFVDILFYDQDIEV